MLLLVAASAVCAAQSQSAAPRQEDNPFFEKLKHPWQLYSARKLDEAAAEFTAVMKQAESAHDLLAQAWSHSALAVIGEEQARYPSARAEHERALALYESIQNDWGIAHANNGLGLVALHLGDMPLARRHYRIALEIFRKLGSLRQQAIVMDSLAWTGDPEAAKLTEEALAIARRVGDKGLEARILERQGDDLFLHGEFDAAQVLFNQAAELCKSIGDKGDLARVLTSEGRLQRAHGHPETSLELYREALKIQQETADRQGEIQSTNAIASTYNFMGDRAHAIEYYERALAMAKKTGSDRMINFESSNLAITMIEAGRNREAVEILERLAPIDQDYPDGRYDSLALAYFNLGRFQDALGASTKAVELGRARAHIEGLPSSLLRKAHIESKLSQRAAALADAEECLRTIEQMRAHLVPDDFMKRGFAEITRAGFDVTIQLLWESGQFGRALEVAEEGRSRAFLDLLATRDLQGERAQTSTAPRGIEEQLPELRAPETKLQLPSTGADRELRSQVSVESIPLEQFRLTARRLNSTILSYWVSSDATYIWVTPAAGEVHCARVEIPDKKLKEKIAGLFPDGSGAAGRGMSAQAGVTTRGGDKLGLNPAGQTHWRALYKTLIAPIEQWLPAGGGNLLTIEAHGPLLMLPFAALQNARGQYLIERFTLHYIPAVSLLQFTEKKKDQVRSAAPGYLLVADPDGTPAGLQGRPLPRLPGARREVTSVARLIPASQATVLEGKDATELRVEEVAGRSSVIHFATHGVIRDDRPFDSFLALGRNGAGSDHDGHYTAQKIYNLHLQANLIFLSACRSGLGQVSGDGINGLTRAFLYAGTPSVVASLWDVADETTHRLVTGFYQRWLRSADKARALRFAQLGLLRALRSGRVSVHTSAGDIALPEDPVLWAGFVLQGEP